MQADCGEIRVFTETVAGICSWSDSGTTQLASAAAESGSSQGSSHNVSATESTVVPWPPGDLELAPADLGRCLVVASGALRTAFAELGRLGTAPLMLIPSGSSQDSSHNVSVTESTVVAWAPADLKLDPADLGRCLVVASGALRTAFAELGRLWTAPVMLVPSKVVVENGLWLR